MDLYYDFAFEICINIFHFTYDKLYSIYIVLNNVQFME